VSAPPLNPKRACVFRYNDATFPYGASFGTLWPDDSDNVTRFNVLQAAEESVAVSGDPEIAGLSNQGCPQDPSHAAVQREVICSSA